MAEVGQAEHDTLSLCSGYNGYVGKILPNYLLRKVGGSMIGAEEHLVTLVGLRNEAYDARVRVQQQILLEPDLGDDDLRRRLAESKSLGEEIIRLDESIKIVQAQIDRV